MRSQDTQTFLVHALCPRCNGRQWLTAPSTEKECWGAGDGVTEMEEMESDKKHEGVGGHGRDHVQSCVWGEMKKHQCTTQHSSTTYTGHTHPQHTQGTLIHNIHRAHSSKTYTGHTHPQHTQGTLTHNIHRAHSPTTYTGHTHPQHTQGTLTHTQHNEVNSLLLHPGCKGVGLHMMYRY